MEPRPGARDTRIPLLKIPRSAIQTHQRTYTWLIAHPYRDPSACPHCLHTGICCASHRHSQTFMLLQPTCPIPGRLGSCGEVVAPWTMTGRASHTYSFPWWGIVESATHIYASSVGNDTKSVFSSSIPSVISSGNDSATAFANQFEQQLVVSRNLNNARYCTDIPLAIESQRKQAGFPKVSLIWPNVNNLLENTVAQLESFHTPYGYESSHVLGAVFTCHVEDVYLCSINHLYTGIKIWYIIREVIVLDHGSGKRHTHLFFSAAGALGK